MAPSIGLNLRVTGHCNQGGRKYMEDVFSVAYQQTEDENDLEYAFFGIFDGHGGKEAAIFAKEHLMDNIVKHQNFWSENDDLVLKAIREGFLKTQNDMWSDLPNWTKTNSGLPSTAGTTASIAFIRRGKIFVGHAGDSGIVLGEQDENHPDVWKSRPLTKDHKPEDESELARIEAAGGKVVNKSGVPRVVWNRPKLGHTGPLTRSTPVDEIPFLAVARALGDLWSYNSKQDIFVVSPDPDLHVYTIDISKQRCLILGTDGAWNVLSPEMAVNAVKQAEKNNEKQMLEGNNGGHQWQNPSKKLVDLAVDRWRVCKLRADNTSVVVVMLDPPGPPRAQVLRRQRDAAKGVGQPKKQACNNTDAPPLPPKPKQSSNVNSVDSSCSSASKGLAIISRFPNSKKPEEASGKNLVASKMEEMSGGRIVHDNIKTEPTKICLAKPETVSSCATNKLLVPPVSSSSGPVAHTTHSTLISEPSSLQSNEVTSSDTECSLQPSSELSSRQFVSSLPSSSSSSSSSSSCRPRKSLSRELASLALDSPTLPARNHKKTSLGRRSSGCHPGHPLPRRRGRSIDSGIGGNESDEENAGGQDSGGPSGSQGQGRSGATTRLGPGATTRLGAMVPADKLEAVEAKCDALNNKIKLMEKKVVDRTELLTAEVRALRQTMGTGSGVPISHSSPARVLRSRNGDETSPNLGSGTKRKRGDQEVRQVKRERTTTWAGRQLRPGLAKSDKPLAAGKGTRKPNNSSPLVSKGRRSLSLLSKKY